MSEAQEKIAKSMFQLVFLVADKEIEQRWNHLQPSVKRQWEDKADSLREVFEELGYRKLEGEPPLLGSNPHGDIRWDFSKRRRLTPGQWQRITDYGDGKLAQLGSDTKWIRGK